MSRREFRDLASQETVRETLDDLDLSTGTETVPLESADGRVLAERLDATIDVPGFDRSSMDGYAVKARDTAGANETDPVSLELIGEVHTGEKPSVTISPGTTAEISTGAVLPPGADAVVEVERTTERDGNIEVRSAVAPGDAVMAAGADIAAGERALGPGTVLTSREIGLLAALGVDSVPVVGRPTVAIISTGDELVRPDGTLEHDRGQIYDVNSYSIASAVREAGGAPDLYPHVGDDEAAMERLLTEAAATSDLILTSGSTSASAVDVIYRVIEAKGELLLHGAAVKPGRPMLVGRIEESAFVGLPGFPVSALTIFRTFVADVIRDAAGRPRPRTATITGKMAVQERYSQGRTRFIPVGVVEDGSGNSLVYPVDKGSGATTSLVEADGIVEMEADTEFLDKGEEVVVRRFSGDLRTPTFLGMGEDDPVLSRLLDHLERPRYLGVGTREGLRRFREDIPDVAVTTGPLSREPAGSAIETWTREWGLIVPPENPAGVTGLADLLDADLRFVNRHRDSGLRASFDEALEAVAAERDSNLRSVTEEINGYDFTVRAHESPARRVASDGADVGLGLRLTAESLDLGYVPIATETVTVYGDESRREKPGFEEFEAAMEDHLGALVEELPGYGR